METTLTSKNLFTGKVLTLTLDTVALDNGSEASREVIRHKGACCVIPLTDDGKVICVKQYRYPYAEELIEIPAGKLDPGESPETCARRELKEETGAAAEKLTYLGCYYGSPAILDERIHMYLAEDLTFGEQHLDEDEFLSVEAYPIETLVNLILEGKIPDGTTQAAVLRAYLMRKEKQS